MPAVASKIFKIRAHSDFISKSDACQDILSFRKGQPFYALSADYEKGFYFVSTQFAVPFSRTAVSGLVPIGYFDKVDLLSKDPPIHRKTVVAAPKPMAASISHEKANMVAANTQAVPSTFPVSNKQSTETHAVPRRKQSLPLSEDQYTLSQISSLKVMSISQDKSTGCESFCIKITRKIPSLSVSTTPSLMTCIINRTIPDFISLATAARKVYKKINEESYPLSFPSREAKIKALEAYLLKLVVTLLPNLDPTIPATEELFQASHQFFIQKQDEVQLAGQTVLRRDSGTDTESNEPNSVDSKQSSNQQKNNNPFASLSKIVFGSSNFVSAAAK